MEKTSSDSVTSSDDLKNEEPIASVNKKVSVAGFDSTFGTKTWREDTTLIVEGKHLYVSSSIISLFSPVFTQMFEEKMTESGPMEIELEGKKYDDILEFLKCMYPNIMKSISLENAFVVLPLAVEYGMEQLSIKCANVLTEGTSDKTPSKDVYMYLSKAIELNLADLRQKCVKVASKNSFKDFKEAMDKFAMPVDVKYEIQCGLLESMEKQLATKECQQCIQKDCQQCIQHEQVIKSVRLNRFLNGATHPSTLKNPRIVYLEYTFKIQGKKTFRRSSHTIAHGIYWTIDIEMPREGSLKLYLNAKISSVHSMQDDWTCRVSGSMCLCNKDSNLDINSCLDTGLFTSSESNWGDIDVIEMEQVLNEEKGFINDGYIKVELYVLIEEPTFEAKAMPRFDIANISVLDNTFDADSHEHYWKSQYTDYVRH